MADIVIIHAADKVTAAARLTDSIVAAGYDVGTLEIEEPDRLADAVEGCAADAMILIWSRPLVSHVLHSGDLSRIRQLPGLIEVSVDGITPPSRGDDSRVVLISGWRGQPFHPGWQRIHADLKRLCGTRRSAAEALRGPSTGAQPRPQPAASSARSRGVPVSPRLLLGGVAALLLAGAGIGAASWFGGRSPETPLRSESGKARPSESIVEAPPPAFASEPSTGEAAENVPPAADPPPSLPIQKTVGAAETRPERPKAEPALRSPRPEAAAASEPKVRPQPEAGPAKKYSPKYSKVMRQFCERSGRSTPQCRTFLRSAPAR